MKKKLIIVESPAKVKTLKKILGSGYLLESSVGHIRDLPKKGFGIDVADNFEPHYVLLDNKKEIVKQLKKSAGQAEMVYLAPDPDREGEAIAWHILSILPKTAKVKRVSFNAITKKTILEALQHPREIDQSLVDAQQARRLLDRIVGYKISPILTRRIQGNRAKGLSAGRVQSVALKLVVDREKEIEQFKSVEYWNVFVTFQPDSNGSPFKAVLYSIDGKKIEKEAKLDKKNYLISNQKVAENIVEELKKESFTLTQIQQKEKLRNPVAPFITSSLQQEASRYFGFSAMRTMNIAQTLYEGIDLGTNQSEGLITYMRTDSVRIEPEAIEEARAFIRDKYGNSYLPETPRIYSTAKSAQDAHEGIRPTHLEYHPELIKSYLNPDQNKLYGLIWRRFIASQMNPAIYQTVAFEIRAKNHYLLRATGSLLKFPGFLKLYEEKKDLSEIEEEKTPLPLVKEGIELLPLGITAEQSFTKPPGRYTEASLVKELEQLGIGRPSTYATIMQKIQGRDYTIKEKNSLKPTELGKVIAQMLEGNFKLIMDTTFTANMENMLEQIAENKLYWKELVAQFWNEFIPFVEHAEKEAFVPKIPTDLNCPQCSHPLQKIWSRSRYFYGCSNYPSCEYTSSIEEWHLKREEYAPEFDWDQKCPKCNNSMQFRTGRAGAFLGCNSYPDCKGSVSIPKKGEVVSQQTSSCPAIGCDGKISLHRSRFGKPFFSCSNYPECDVIVNHLDDLANKYINYPKTASTRIPSKKQKKNDPVDRKLPQISCSKELEDFLGTKIVSRSDLMKQIWAYIKKEHLQNPENRRKIILDPPLVKLFGTTQPIDMMELPKYLNQHISSNKKK